MGCRSSATISTQDLSNWESSHGLLHSCDAAPCLPLQRKHGQGYCLPSPHVPRHSCFYVWGTLQRVCLWGSAYSGRFHQEHLPPDSSCRPQPCSPQCWSAQLEWGPSSGTAHRPILLLRESLRVKSIIEANDNCDIYMEAYDCCWVLWIPEEKKLKTIMK